MYSHLFLQDTESNLLKEAKLKLEDITFDIQCFISEHAQFLSPAQSSYLLKFLSTTQRAFRDQTERLVTQRSTLGVLLDTRERESQEKVCLMTYCKISQMFHRQTTVYTCSVCYVKLRWWVALLNYTEKITRLHAQVLEHPYRLTFVLVIFNRPSGHQRAVMDKMVCCWSDLNLDFSWAGCWGEAVAPGHPRLGSLTPGFWSSSRAPHLSGRNIKTAAVSCKYM